jgi:hypothetical protein
VEAPFGAGIAVPRRAGAANRTGSLRAPCAHGQDTRDVKATGEDTTPQRVQRRNAAHGEPDARVAPAQRTMTNRVLRPMPFCETRTQ